MDLLFKIIAALGSVTGVVAAVMIWRARQPVALKPVCCGAPVAEEQTPQSALRQRFVRAIDYLRTRREWRYQAPWILLLGQSGSGKSSLLASMPAGHRLPAQGRQNQLAVSGTEWQFFGKGVLIDPNGRWPAAAANSKGAAEWSRVLDEIDDLRPERALDGLLVAISAATLQHGSAEERQALAENIRAQLRTIQERFEFTLPVYVVVTATDTVEGFASFWRSQPPSRRNEIVGWSAPTQVANGLPLEWADAAFDSVGRQLKALQVDAAASCERIAPADADDFFLFPRHFQQLRAPFSQWLSVVFQPSAWQAGFFCRGVYFTGAVAATGAAPANQEQMRPDVSFVDDLILKKVLAESKLGRPTRQGLWSRSKQIRTLQMAGIGALGILLVALCIAGLRVNRQVDNVVASLKLMQQLDKPGTQAQGDACIGQEPVYRLIAQVARIDADTTYLALPLSWFDQRLSKKSARRIADGAFQNVVLPGVACRLTQRAKDLYDMTPSMTSYTQSLAGLFDYVQKAEALEQNLARYHGIIGDPPYSKTHIAMPDFVALVEYAYGEPLPAKVKSHPGVLPATLGAAAYKGVPQLQNNLKQSVASRIAQLAQQVHSQLGQELQLGNRLLAKLEQQQEPMLANAKDFSRWLTWVRKSWLGSSASANPIQQIRDDLAARLKPLIRQYGYPEQTLNAASAQFDVSKEYPASMKLLSSMQMPSYGSLFTTQNNVLDLNPKLVAEQNGMSALVALDFMQVDPTQAFSCQSKISGWNPAQIGMANNYAQEYDRFARNQGLTSASAASATQRPLYDRLARRQLELVLDNTLQQAQVPPASASATQSTGVDFTSPPDLRQEQQSNDFAKLLQSILNLQRFYRDKNFAGASPLAQCVRNFASDSLGQVQALADQSQLYQPTPGAGASKDATFFDLGSTPVIKDYLSRQVERVQTLARYATPYLNYLNNSEASSTAQRSNAESVPYWNNTVAELNRSLSKDASGQAGQLESLFLKTLPDMTGNNCAKTLSAYVPAEYGNDLFSVRRQQLEKQVQLRCKGARHSQAYTAYNTWASRFNRELAGHYPFGPLDASDDSATTVRNFFSDYEAASASLHQSINGLDDPYWDSVRSFLNQLDAVAKFFHGNLVPTDAGDVAPIKLTVVFRAQAADSPGSNQVVSWALSSASKSIGAPNRPNNLDWSYSQPLVVDMSWANYSLLRPAADSSQSDLKIDGTLASFAASGNWALLRLVERHRRAAQPDPKSTLLEFDVPVTSNETRFSKTPDTVKLFLAFSLSDAKTSSALKIPDAFPRQAPQ